MLPVEQPFKIYTGLDGKPLNDGFIYFGQPNQNPQTKPVTVYWDAAGTIPAAQPLRTLGGYIVRAGAPAAVFFEGSYSQLVLDSKKRQVSIARTSDEFSVAGAVSSFMTRVGSATGSKLVGFSAGVAAISRLLQDKVLETMISATDYGAKDDGLTDDRIAEALASTVAREGRNLMRGGEMFTAHRRGIKVYKSTSGIKDAAAVVSITAGNDDDEPVTQVLGFANDADVGGYPDRDHVGLFVQTIARPALVTTSNTTFSDTSVTSSDLTAAIAAGKIKRGMMIDTGETPKKTGTVIGASGSTITVSAWYVVAAARGVGTPAAGTTIYVNPSTKVWALNANVLLPADAMATGAVGFELGLVNDKTDGAGYLYDAVNLGSKRGGTAFQCRGSWVEGFHAYEGTNFGFTSQKAAVINFYAAGGPIGFQADAAAGVAFLAKGGGTALEVRNTDGATLTYLNATGAWNRLKLQGVSFLANQTIDADTVVCLAPPVSAVTIINLPTPTGVGANGQRLLYLKNPKSSTANVLWAGLVEDASGSIATTPGTALTMWSNGASWIPIGKFSYT
jgi:hypothetical protein